MNNQFYIFTYFFNASEVRKLRKILYSFPKNFILQDSGNNLFKNVDSVNEYTNAPIVLLKQDGRKKLVFNKIKKIFTKFPGAQVVLVSKKFGQNEIKDFFCLGGRDILNLPLNGKNLKASLNRCIDFIMLWKKNQLLNESLSITHILTNRKHVSTTDELCEIGAELLWEKFKLLSFSILSFNREELIKNNEYKVEWKRENNNQKISLDLLLELAKPFERNQKNSAFYKILKIEKNTYILANLTESEDRTFYLIIESELSSKEQFENQYIDHFILIFQSTFKQITQEEMQKGLIQLSHSDDVTGLRNTRRMRLDLNDLIAKYDKMKKMFSVIFIDIDHFKTVNDEHGHVLGSELLIQFATELKKILRGNDYIYRYGGDEFVVVVPKTDENEARKIGLRVLKQIQEKKFVLNSGMEFHIGVSIGLALFPLHAKSLKELLELSDAMMYKAKKLGRGQVCLASDYLKENQSKAS